MTPENFCYWLQSSFELCDTKQFSEQQVQIIKDHLALVFNKQTPEYWTTTPNYDLSGGGSHTGSPKFPQVDNVCCSDDKKETKFCSNNETESNFTGIDNGEIFNAKFFTPTEPPQEFDLKDLQKTYISC